MLANPRQEASMSLKQKAMNSATQLLKTGIQVLGGRRSTLISAHLAEELTPVIIQKTDFGTINFFCPVKIPEWHAQTLLTKEPETIECINTFNDNDVFWDIGANVGCIRFVCCIKKYRSYAI